MTVKSKQRFSWTYNHETGLVVCTDKVTERRLEIQVADFPQEIQDHFKVYSIPKRLQELTSSIPLESKFEAFEARVKQLKDGVWNATRKGGGLGIVPAYIEVVAAKRGWKGNAGIAKAQAAWKQTSDEVKAQLLELWAEDIEAVKAARASQDDVGSLDDMLDQS